MNTNIYRAYVHVKINCAPCPREWDGSTIAGVRNLAIPCVLVALAGCLSATPPRPLTPQEQAQAAAKADFEARYLEAVRAECLAKPLECARMRQAELDSRNQAAAEEQRRRDAWQRSLFASPPTSKEVTNCRPDGYGGATCTTTTQN